MNAQKQKETMEMVQARTCSHTGTRTPHGCQNQAGVPTQEAEGTAGMHARGSEAQDTALRLCRLPHLGTCRKVNRQGANAGVPALSGAGLFSSARWREKARIISQHPCMAVATAFVAMSVVITTTVSASFVSALPESRREALMGPDGFALRPEHRNPRCN